MLYCILHFHTAMAGCFGTDHLSLSQMWIWQGASVLIWILGSLNSAWSTSVRRKKFTDNLNCDKQFSIAIESQLDRHWILFAYLTVMTHKSHSQKLFEFHNLSFHCNLVTSLHLCKTQNTFSTKLCLPVEKHICPLNPFMLIISHSPVRGGLETPGSLHGAKPLLWLRSAAQHVLSSREAESDVRGRILAQKAHVLGAG